jgi:lipopolysaccharide export system protein LptA
MENNHSSFEFRHSPMLALRRFVLALLVTGLVFGAYALAVAPWLEPPGVKRAEYSGERKQFTSSLALRNFSDLFAAGSWELDDPKVIETATCTLLLKTYNPLPDGRLEITPCTLVFYLAPTKEAVAAAAKSGDQEPERRRVVMRALKGAVLTFDKPLNLGSAEFGRLLGGQLKGTIKIFSPETEPGRNDALEIETEGVQIERQKIYTPYKVDFRYGASHGRGRDLTITLLPPDEEKKTRAQSFGGISYLQLSQVERLHLEGAAALMPGPGQATVRKNEPPLEVRCQGPLIVDLDNRQARLDDHVEITRVYEQGPPDKLTCDRLLFRLAASGGRPPPDHSTASLTKKNQGGDVPRSPENQLASTVERIHAVGTPAIIDAPQSQLYAKAASMDYTLASRVVRLNNGPTGAPVILRQGKNRFEARGIEYESAAPGRLGKLFATGPGELEFVQASGETVNATWKESLHIRPDQGSHAISLLDDARVMAGSMGSFFASELHLWLKEVPRPATAAARGSVIAKPSFSLVPERMLAVCQLDQKGNPINFVEIDSPQLQAKTNRLEAWFVEATPEQLAANAPRGLPGTKPPQPAPGWEGDDAGAGPDPPAPRQKLDVSGDLVKLQFLLFPQPVVENLAITGKVLVEEVQTARPEDLPLQLSGDGVTLIRGSGPNAELEIKGRPAQVSARGLTLSGATIHLHRGENRLWIDGPGEAELPVPRGGLQMRTLQPPPGENPDHPAANFPAAETIGEVRPVKVTWTNGMNFDGFQASFAGEVKVRGEGEYAAAETLDVRLSQRIDFSAPQQAGPAEIALLTLAGGKSPVIIQQITRDHAGEQTSFDNLRTGKVTIDRQANTLTVEGPGEVWTVRKDSPALVPETVDPLQKPSDGKLTYICVTFAGAINGKLDTREIRFERQVDTTYGRVSDWKDRILATRVVDLGPTGAHMKSEALTVTEMALSKAQKWVELEATGNVIVEGKSFVAQAARIGYTSDKDQLVLEGDGRNDAEFWHQATSGSEHSHTKAGRIRFQRKTGTLELNDGKTQTISLGSLPPSKVPLPRRR